MKLKIFLFLLLSTVSFAQWSTPLGKTPFLKLRYYSLDAQPGPDSIKQNLLDIDTWAKSTNDTLLALLSRANAVINYSGVLNNGIIEYDNFSTTLKTKLVTKDLNETISGSKTFTATNYARNFYPTTDLTYNLGTPTAYWRRAYIGWVNANYIILANPIAPSDTAIVTYDGSNLIFDKSASFQNGLNITGNISADSFKVGSSLRYVPYTLVVNKSDSVGLTLNNFTLFLLNPSDNVPVIKTLENYMPAGTGRVVYLVNTSSSYTITLKDEYGGGNLILNGDFVMGKNDAITLIYLYQGFSTWAWVELSRSNN